MQPIQTGLQTGLKMAQSCKSTSVVKQMSASCLQKVKTPITSNHRLASHPVSRSMRTSAKNSCFREQVWTPSFNKITSSKALPQHHQTPKTLTPKEQPFHSKIPSAEKAASTQKTRESFKSVPIWVGGALLGTLALHSTISTEDNYYEYRFTTEKDPELLAEFYGSEQFMDIFCVVPFMGTLLMKGGEFDDHGTFHTTGFPGTLSVNMVFSETKDKESGETVWFNKRERFKDTLGQQKMWDTVMNFGFRKLPNGKIECYHTGEYFKGSAPPVSLMVKLLFQIHARWVAWATEHHLNNHDFVSNNGSDASIEQSARQDMPLHLLKHHLLNDLKAMLLGKSEEPSPTTQLPPLSSPSPSSPLPLKEQKEQKSQTKQAEQTSPISQITQEPSDDPNSDTVESVDTVEPIEVRPTPKPSFLILNHRESAPSSQSESDDDNRHNSDESRSVSSASSYYDNSYDSSYESSDDSKSQVEGSIAYDLPISKRLPMRKIKADIEHDKKAHSNSSIEVDDFRSRNFSGNQAWELLRSTNKPEVYQKVTEAAKLRRNTRRVTNDDPKKP